MTDDVELLHAALESSTAAEVDADIVSLVQVADEVRAVLHRESLTARERDRLYARATALAVRGRRWASARRLLVDNRVRALAGGAFTLAAGAVITVAVRRQHRHHAPVPI
ncbi:MAG: hypothetical protein ABR498_01480 [Candidatus Dormibacteria bacterium]